MLGQGLDVLGADELVVVWGPDVYDVLTTNRRARGDKFWKIIHGQWWRPRAGEGLYVQTRVRMGFSGSEAGEKGV